MPLTWSVADCRDWQELLAETPDGRPVTECIVFATMAIGVPQIHAATARGFYRRCSLWEAGLYPLNTTGRPITPDDVYRRIGLRTNARRTSDAEFKATLFSRMAQKADDTWDREISKHVLLQ